MSPVVTPPQLTLTRECSLNNMILLKYDIHKLEEPNCGYNSPTCYALMHMLEKSFLCVDTIIHFTITSSTAGLSN